MEDGMDSIKEASLKSMVIGYWSLVIGHWLLVEVGGWKP